MGNKMLTKNLVWRSKKCSKSVLLFLVVGLYPLLLDAALATQDSIVTSSVLNYNDSHGVPVVNVSINGRGYSFLFDTGAGMTCISDKVVSEAGLFLRSTSNYIVGMDGNVSYATISSLVFGDVKADSLEAIVLPGNNPGLRAIGVDGISGANAFSDFVVTFDAKTKTIMIEKSVIREEGDWMPMKLWDGLPLLALKLRGKEELYDVPGVFDSGSSMGAFGLPSVKGFEEWTVAGLIDSVEEGQGTTTLMLGGRVGMDKLYRGELKECHIGNGVFSGIPVYTGGIDYLLLCFKITDLGKLTLDYPNKRFSFTAYEGAAVWEGDQRPVTTAVINGELKITAVWGKEALEKIAPGYTVTALDGKPTNKVPPGIPNIDVFIGMVKAKTVTVRDMDGNEQTLPATLFLAE